MRTGYSVGWILVVSWCIGCAGSPEPLAQPVDAATAAPAADAGIATPDTSGADLDAGFTDVGGLRDAQAESPEAGGPGLIGGTGSCIEALQCSFGCTDEPCFEGCVNATLPRNREATEAALACSREHACVDPNCVMMNCQEQARACGEAGGETPPPASGDAGMPTRARYTCADMIRCVNACGADTMCFNGCLERIREESTENAAILTQCMMNARCIDMTCGQRSCPEAYQQCWDDDD